MIDDTPSPTDFGFTGQRKDGFGLYDYNARFYSPYLGRFISPDTVVPKVENPQHWNRYSYVYNNPLKFIDPTGRTGCTGGGPSEDPVDGDSIPDCDGSHTGGGSRGGGSGGPSSRSAASTNISGGSNIGAGGPVDEAGTHASTTIPGLPKDQADKIFKFAFDRNSSVVIGGSRVRGNFRADSDLDVGFGNLSQSQANNLIKQVNKLADIIKGWLKMDKTKIVPGNHPPGLEKPIKSPEDFFMSSGIRSANDARAGQPFSPSGYIKYEPEGSITRVFPDGTTQIIK